MKIVTMIKDSVLFIGINKYIQPGRKVTVEIDGIAYDGESCESPRKKRGAMIMIHPYERVVWADAIITNRS